MNILGDNLVDDESVSAGKIFSDESTFVFLVETGVIVESRLGLGGDDRIVSAEVSKRLIGGILGFLDGL